jgi:hypothetical protein
MDDLIESFQIQSEFVMLCEGHGDNEFFKKLIQQYKLPNFDFPFPPLTNDGSDAEGRPLHSRDGFGNMLEKLAAYFDFNKSHPVRGILIAADATDRPKASLTHIRKQIEAVPDFGVPNEQRSLEPSKAGWPAIGIILIPMDSPGGLETLCVAAMSEAFAGELECTEKFLECCPQEPGLWGREKADKVRLQCLIAATYKPNPTRSLRYAFTKLRKAAPAIDIA